MLGLQFPFSLFIAGPSGCGKTEFVLKLLDCIKNKFDYILWVNSENNAIPKKICDLSQVEIMKEIPNSFGSVPDGTLIILDDMMTEAYTKNVCELFTKGSHHKNLSVILITQNIFHQGRYARDIALNSKYLVFFKNPRDKAQIYPLARQIYPEKPSEIVRVYNEATSEPHSYLFFDLTQATHELFRFRTDIFNKNHATYFIPSHLIENSKFCVKHETIGGKQTYITCVE